MDFFDKCVELFGDRVITDKDYLNHRSNTTFYTSNKLLGILKLNSVDEISKAVKLANQYDIKISTSSCGQNYGYGNSSPNVNNSVLIDLSLINKIFNYDEEQGFITVGPGVTFLQAFNFLTEKTSDYVLAGTGAPSHSSLIGNLAERGIGKGITGNRSDYVCSLEIVLPTGDIINTGMGRFKDSAVNDLTRWGPGPQFDGLFIQSNLGIISKATFWLTKKPKYFQSFIYTIKDQAKLPAMVNALHRLKQDGIIDSNFAIFNDYRVIAFFDAYPFDQHSKKEECLPREILHDRLEQLMVKSATWFGDGALFNHSKDQARAVRKIVKKELSPYVDNLIFFNQSNIGLFKLIAKLLKFFNRKLILQDLLTVFYDCSSYLGFPTHVSLKGTYWRKKILPTVLDPINDKCGVYWLGPMVPFNGDHVEKAIVIIENIITKYGFEPAITLQCLTSRQIDIITSITYDREIEKEDERARECHDELLSVLIKEGYYPYRLGTQSYLSLPDSNDSTTSFFRSMKKALDPNDIMSPERYDFRNNWKLI